MDERPYATPEAREAYWERVRETAQRVRSQPGWVRTGIGEGRMRYVPGRVQEMARTVVVDDSVWERLLNHEPCVGPRDWFEERFDRTSRTVDALVALCVSLVERVEHLEGILGELDPEAIQEAARAVRRQGR